MQIRVLDRNSRFFAALLGLAMVIGLIVVLPAPRADAATSVAGFWQMNEGPNASTMIDSGPYHLDGHIGDDIITGGTYAGATEYRWLYKRPNEPPAEPERLAIVEHDPRLNPGNGDYAIEFRYRTTKNFGNVVQKGQSHSAGGYFKFEQPNGYMTCLFKDSSGKRRATTSPIATNDGQWHTIRCELDGSRLKLYIDGNMVRNVSQSLGTIANTKNLSIGGKYECTQQAVTCDYFTGSIDYVKIETASSGGTPPPPPPPPPPSGSDISFVGSDTDSANTSNVSVNLPAVQSGDVVVLFASAASPVTINNPSGVGGWTSVGTETDSKLTTRVWVRTAQSGDSGDRVTVGLSSRAKVNLTVLAYRGVSTGAPIANSASDDASGRSAQRTTPQVSVSDGDSLGVSFWAHRDSSTTSLDAPSGVAIRASDTYSGGGHPTILVADSNGGTGSGSYGNLTATADSASSYGVTWTIILRPA